MPPRKRPSMTKRQRTILEEELEACRTFRDYDTFIMSHGGERQGKQQGSHQKYTGPRSKETYKHAEVPNHGSKELGEDLRKQSVNKQVSAILYLAIPVAVVATVAIVAAAPAVAPVVAAFLIGHAVQMLAVIFAIVA